MAKTIEKKVAAPLDKETLKRLSKLGIEATTESKARKELQTKLAEEGVDGTDDDSLKDLMEMYVNVLPEEEAAEEEEAEEEEAEDEETAHEEEEEYDEAAEEDEEEEEADDEEEADEDEEEEEEEEEAPTPKAKKTVAPVAAKKAAAPAKKTSTRVKGEPFDANGNKEHAALLLPLLKKEFPDLEVKVLKQGVTVFLETKSQKRALFGYDRVKVVAGDKPKLVGDLFFNALKGMEAVEEAVDLGDLDREFKKFNQNLIFVPQVSAREMVTIIKANGLYDKMLKDTKAADKRAVAAREKMEEKMASEPKKGIKAPVKGAPVVAKKAAAPAPVVKKPSILDKKVKK